MSCGLMLFKARGGVRLMVGHEREIIKANCFTSRLNCVESLWLDKERERERERDKEGREKCKDILKFCSLWKQERVLERQRKLRVLNVLREKSECTV